MDLEPQVLIQMHGRIIILGNVEDDRLDAQPSQSAYQLSANFASEALPPMCGMGEHIPDRSNAGAFRQNVDSGNGDEFTLVIGAVERTFLELSSVKGVWLVCVIREECNHGIKVIP
jgi:hypothetical protein